MYNHCQKNQKSQLQSNEVLIMFPNGHFEVKKLDPGSVFKQDSSQKIIDEKFGKIKENLEKLIEKMFEDVFSSKLQKQVQKIISEKKKGDRSLIPRENQNRQTTLLTKKLDEISMKTREISEQSKQVWSEFYSFKIEMISKNEVFEKQIKELSQSLKKVTISRGHEKSQESEKETRNKMKEIQNQITSLKEKISTQEELTNGIRQLMGNFDDKLRNFEKNVKKSQQKVGGIFQREKSSSTFLSHSMSSSNLMSQMQKSKKQAQSNVKQMHQPRMSKYSFQKK